MRYTVDFQDRVSDSVFIYAVRNNILYGCDAIIRTNYDRELDKDELTKKLDFNKIQFKVERNFFESKPTPDIENKLCIVEDKQRQRGWNCMRTDGREEFGSAIGWHLSNYQEAVKNRIILSKSKLIVK